ncbi:glycosyltransferase family 4 protein [Isoptericola sp. G70]|uniref:glycosyltransferase family 4 protein n=1 Tax=Isoptericola sp. G70 TaxID=3376633 RepID=UPI003A7FEA0F
MRILHAMASDGFAGVERHVARLARAQHDAGHTVHVLGGAPGPMLAELRPTGSGPTYSPATTTGALVRALVQHRQLADVLHVHMTAAEVAATVAFAGRPRTAIPVVVSTRHFARRRGHGLTGPLVTRVARHRVDRQLAVSRHVAAHVDGEATVVLPGIDDRPDPPPSAARDRTVLVAQRLQPEKRTDLALEAFVASGVAAAGWRLDVAGDGASSDGLERHAARLGLEPGTHVRFLGARTDVVDLMQTAGILLAPCPVEGLGLSVLEAMASRLPVVAFPAGGHLELLDGVAAVCLPPSGDVAGMARSLAALASDDALRDTVADAALARQRQHCTPAAQVARTTAVYEQALRHAPLTEVLP